MNNRDPFRCFRFIVEISGIQSGGFTRIKGINREVKYESFREGGVNDYEHKLLSQVSHSHIVLERGLINDDLWNWAQKVADGEIKRRTLHIRLRNEEGAPVWAWQIAHALPVKWSVSDLDAQSASVVMESLELVHHGLRKAT